MHQIETPPIQKEKTIVQTKQPVKYEHKGGGELFKIMIEEWK